MPSYSFKLEPQKFPFHYTQAQPCVNTGHSALTRDASAAYTENQEHGLNKDLKQDPCKHESLVLCLDQNENQSTGKAALLAQET